MTSTINIETCDSVVFKIPKGIAGYFKSIQDIFESYDSNDLNDTNIPITAPAYLFKEVLDFAEHCHPNETKEKQWIDAVSADKMHFFAIMGVANALSWKHLLELIGKKVADTLNGKSADEMKEYLEFDEVLMEDYINTIKVANPRMITA